MIWNGRNRNPRKECGRKGTAASPVVPAKPTLAITEMTDATARPSSHPGEWKRKMITEGSILLTQKNRALPASSLENGAVINDTTHILFMLIYFMLQLQRDTEKDHSTGQRAARLSRNECGHTSKQLRSICQAQQIVVIIILFWVLTILHHIFISLHFSLLW